jgi:hypothetical protein
MSPMDIAKNVTILSERSFYDRVRMYASLLVCQSESLGSEPAPSGNNLLIAT